MSTNSFHSHQRLRLGVQGPGVFCNSVPGDTNCHPSILNSRQMAPKTATNCPSNCWFLFSFFGLPQVFVGNTDENTIVCNELNGSIVARYTRFQPTAWHNHISMRVELYGCKGTFFLVTSFFCGIRKKYKQILVWFITFGGLYYFTANINIYIYRHGVSWPLKKPIEETFNSDTLTSAWLHRMPKIEKKEFMTHVVPIHCGDPLKKQQTITKQTKIKFWRTKKYFISTLCYWAYMLWFNFFLGLNFILFV